MWEDGMHQFFFRRLQCPGNTVALDKFCHFSADHVGAQQLAGFCIENGFYQTFRFAECNGLAVTHKRETPDFHVVSRFFGLGFRHPDRRDLRKAVSTSGHI